MSKEVVVNIKADTGKSKKELEDLVKKFDKLQDKAKEIEKQLSETTDPKKIAFLKKELASVNSALGNTEKATKKAGKSTSLFKKGFSALSNVIKISPLGFLIGLVAKLTQAFSQNQKVVDAVSGVFNGINIIFTQVTDAVVSAYESVSQATGGFDALGKVIKGLLTLAITPLKLSFYAIKLAVQETQLAWEKSFFGDNDPKVIKDLNARISETKENIKEVGDEAVKAGVDVVANVGEAISEVGALGEAAIDNISEINVKSSIEQGKALTEARKAAQIAQVELQGLIEKYDRQAEVQRQIRDDERLSIDDRIKANDELGKVLENQLDAQLKLANQRVAAARLEMKATGDNIENQVALKEALNEVAAVEAQITGFQSEQRVNEAALQKERLENLNEIALIGATEEERKRIEAEQELERQRLLIEKTISNEQEKNAALLLAKQEYDTTLKEIQAETDAKEEERKEKKDAEELERERIVADAKKQILDASLDNAAKGFNLLSQLAGKNKKLQAAAIVAENAVGIAKQVISTRAANAAVTAKYALIPGGVALAAAEKTMNNVSLGLGIATSVKATADALKGLKAGGSPTTSSRGGGNASGGSVAAPQFNIVGQDSQSQAAQVIGENQQQPVQAYVVANDVTTAQSLNNNIVDGASLG